MKTYAAWLMTAFIVTAIAIAMDAWPVLILTAFAFVQAVMCVLWER